MVEPVIGMSQILSLGEISSRFLATLDVVTYRDDGIPPLLVEIPGKLARLRTPKDVRNYIRWFATAMIQDLDQFETKERLSEEHEFHKPDLGGMG